MEVYINKKEIEAIRKAWEQVNCACEGCSNDDRILEMNEILRCLDNIDSKYKRTQINKSK